MFAFRFLLTATNGFPWRLHLSQPNIISLNTCASWKCDNTGSYNFEMSSRACGRYKRKIKYLCSVCERSAGSNTIFCDSCHLLVCR